MTYDVQKYEQRQRTPLTCGKPKCSIILSERVSLSPNRAKAPVYADAIPMPDIVLPGQPIPLPRGPIPRSGSGIYIRDAQLRASLVGVPRMDGAVRSTFWNSGWRLDDDRFLPGRLP